MNRSAYYITGVIIAAVLALLTLWGVYIFYFKQNALKNALLISAPLKRVHGRVLSIDGAPLAGVKIESVSSIVRFAALPLFVVIGNPIDDVTTDANGSFSFTTGEGGPRYLSITKEGFDLSRFHKSNSVSLEEPGIRWQPLTSRVLNHTSAQRARYEAVIPADRYQNGQSEDVFFLVPKHPPAVMELVDGVKGELQIHRPIFIDVDTAAVTTERQPGSDLELFRGRALEQLGYSPIGYRALKNGLWCSANSFEAAPSQGYEPGMILSSLMLGKRISCYGRTDGGNYYRGSLVITRVSPSSREPEETFRYEFAGQINRAGERWIDAVYEGSSKLFVLAPDTERWWLGSLSAETFIPVLSEAAIHKLWADRSSTTLRVSDYPGRYTAEMSNRFLASNPLTGIDRLETLAAEGDSMVVRMMVHNPAVSFELLSRARARLGMHESWFTVRQKSGRIIPRSQVQDDYDYLSKLALYLQANS